MKGEHEEKAGLKKNTSRERDTIPEPRLDSEAPAVNPDEQSFV